MTLRNLYIADLGIKIFLKKVKFGGLREENVDFHLQIEAKMLYDFGIMLIEMLSNEVDEHKRIVGTIDDILNNLEIEPELKAIIYECLHAKDKIVEKE